MMDQFLELQLRLLIAQYGRPKVLRALADLGEAPVENLEQELKTIATKRRARSRTRHMPRSMIELVDTQCQEHPNIAEPLRALAVAFDNRMFLPNLRDCQRFLSSIDPKQPKLKSREAAAVHILSALVNLTRENLERLNVNISGADESDFVALARTIMQGATPEAPKGVE